MLAAQLHRYSDTIDEPLSVEDIERPAIESPTDVIVKIAGAGWCQTDNHLIKGMYKEYIDVDFPHVLGHENSGTVVDTGEQVSTVDVGDNVVCHPVMSCGLCRPCRKGEDMHCRNKHGRPGLTTDGGFAEYMRASNRSVIPIEGLDPVTVAPLADAGLTAYRAAKKATRQLAPGEYVCAVGIGGLGYLAIQILKAISSARIIAVDIRRSALKAAETAGADYCLNATEQNVKTEINAITDGQGITQLLDFVGNETTTSYAPDILRQDGVHHVIGVEGTVSQPSQLLVNREISYAGSLVGSHTEFQELIALAAQGEVSPRISRFSLTEVNKVARLAEHGELDARAIIQP